MSVPRWRLAPRAPTIAELAGVTPAGRSSPSLRILSGRTRDGFAIEYLGRVHHFRAVRTKAAYFVEWSDGAREFYDMDTDPVPERSLPDDAAYADRVAG